jgi:hypothetical protein
MNRNFAATALVLAAAFAGNAFAEGPILGSEPFTGTRTRADVQAELATYRSEGVNPWSMSYNPLKTFRSGTTRAAVTADYVASRDLVHAFTGEDSGSSYLAQARTPALAERILAGQPHSAQ